MRYYLQHPDFVPANVPLDFEEIERRFQANEIDASWNVRSEHSKDSIPVIQLLGLSPSFQSAPEGIPNQSSVAQEQPEIDAGKQPAVNRTQTTVRWIACMAIGLALLFFGYSLVKHIRVRVNDDSCHHTA
jgi:hypothetical protein